MQETKAINSKCFKKLDQQCEYLLLHFAIQYNTIESGQILPQFCKCSFRFQKRRINNNLPKTQKSFIFVLKCPQG